MHLSIYKNIENCTKMDLLPMLGEGTMKGKKDVAKEKLISQIFKIDPQTYRLVRTLAAGRRGTNKAATGQEIYAEAIREYLTKNAAELQDLAKTA